MNEQESQIVIDYFRNKAAGLEMQNVQLQLQVMKLNEQLREDQPESVEAE